MREQRTANEPQSSLPSYRIAPETPGGPRSPLAIPHGNRGSGRRGQRQLLRQQARRAQVLLPPCRPQSQCFPFDNCSANRGLREKTGGRRHGSRIPRRQMPRPLPAPLLAQCLVATRWMHLEQRALGERTGRPEGWDKPSARPKMWERTRALSRATRGAGGVMRHLSRRRWRARAPRAPALPRRLLPCRLALAR